MTQIDGQDAFTVECFVAERKKTKTLPQRFLVRFKGYGPAYDDWRPASDLRSDLGTAGFNTFVRRMRGQE